MVWTWLHGAFCCIGCSCASGLMLASSRLAAGLLGRGIVFPCALRSSKAAWGNRNIVNGTRTRAVVSTNRHPPSRRVSKRTKCHFRCACSAVLFAYAFASRCWHVKFRTHATNVPLSHDTPRLTDALFKCLWGFSQVTGAQHTWAELRLSSHLETQKQPYIYRRYGTELCGSGGLAYLSITIWATT